MILSISRLHSANDIMTKKLEGGGHGLIKVLPITQAFTWQDDGKTSEQSE
jgi:hypothetical protein